MLVERRGVRERQRTGETCPDTERTLCMTTELVRFTQRAKASPQRQYTALMGLLSDPAGLQASFRGQPGNKAAGVDRVRKADYAQGLEGRVTALSSRLRRLGYRPHPVRRVYIPKATGGWRPLGIPCCEDRLVQDRLRRILQAIWEPEFRSCSYGFRPHRNAHQALKRVGEIIPYGGTQWVVEADIQGFFNSVSHAWLMTFLRQRIADPVLLRVIRRFLKAGVLEDGMFQATDAGTPQGGLVSPVLANIYLHDVLDCWFERRYAPTCQGCASLVRYADDFVACFTHEADARRFQAALADRLAQCALALEPAKTRLLCFGSQARRQGTRLGLKRPATFNFLGFTHYVGRSRRGRFVVGRKTQRERIAQKLKAVSDRLARLRVQGARAMLEFVQKHLQGHLAYYGVSGNSRSLRHYVYRLSRVWYKWLNRRSQRRSISWARFRDVLVANLPRVRIQHNLYPTPPWMTLPGSRMV